MIQLISMWIFKRIEIHSLYHIPFKYLDSNVFPFTFHVEDGERRSQSCYDEHDWFGTNLTRNIRGWLCPNITGGSKYSGLPTVKFKPLL